MKFFPWSLRDEATSELLRVEWGQTELVTTGYNNKTQQNFKMLDSTPTIEELRELSQKLPEKIPYLKMLVLFGSRAIGKAHENSDWDFAALYDEELRKEHVGDNAWALLEVPLILGQFFQINNDIVDVVELDRRSPLLNYHVARDGKLLYEKQPGEFVNFQRKAWKIYADTAKFRKAQRRGIDLWLQKWGVCQE